MFGIESGLTDEGTRYWAFMCRVTDGAVEVVERQGPFMYFEADRKKKILELNHLRAQQRKGLR